MYSGSGLIVVSSMGNSSDIMGNISDVMKNINDVMGNIGDVIGLKLKWGHVRPSCRTFLDLGCRHLLPPQFRPAWFWGRRALRVRGSGVRYIFTVHVL